MSSVDNFCKQFGPRMPGMIWIKTVWHPVGIFMKEFLKKLNLKKIQQMPQKHAQLPRNQWVKLPVHHNSDFRGQYLQDNCGFVSCGWWDHRYESGLGHPLHDYTPRGTVRMPGRNWQGVFLTLILIIDFCLLMLNVPVNNFSVMLGNFCLPGLNQYYAKDKVSCSRTQHSASSESRTSHSLIPSLNILPLCSENVVCFLRLLHIFKCSSDYFSLGNKHYEPWSDCS